MRDGAQNPRNDSSRRKRPTSLAGRVVWESPSGLEGSGREGRPRSELGRPLGERLVVDSAMSSCSCEGWGLYVRSFGAERAVSVRLISPLSIRVSTDRRIRSRFRESWSIRGLPRVSSAHNLDARLSSCWRPTSCGRLLDHSGTL